MPLFASKPKPGRPLESSRGLSVDSGSTYLCPVCRHGQIEAMTLMDAFACNFCRHIFEVNLEQQTVQVVDSSQPMSWRWIGHRWQSIYQGKWDMTLMLWIVVVALVLVPAGLVATSAYVFPPLEGSPGEHLPLYWAAGTLLIHLLMVLWLLGEYYQAPLYVAAKIRFRHWAEQVSGG
ncbi:hypothetical protein [Pseudanabaena sp. FACHB-2040]|uniref:hypothetical protein n=1 Tax=Pseudanabaena sp. FACHB-2040 TaxID=2692859 RepID=UPI0018EFE6FA|nr:hypothetical protein [Pseudanabaena sp. FACHB-2040]